MTDDVVAKTRYLTCPHMSANHLIGMRGRHTVARRASRHRTAYQLSLEHALDDILVLGRPSAVRKGVVRLVAVLSSRDVIAYPIQVLLRPLSSPCLAQEGASRTLYSLPQFGMAQRNFLTI